MEGILLSFVTAFQSEISYDANAHAKSDKIALYEMKNATQTGTLIIQSHQYTSFASWSFCVSASQTAGIPLLSKSNSQKYGEPIIEFYPNTAVPEGVLLIKQTDHISSTALNGQHDRQTLGINHNHNQTQNRLSIYLYSPLKRLFPAFTKQV